MSRRTEPPINVKRRPCFGVRRALAAFGKATCRRRSPGSLRPVDASPAGASRRCLPMRTRIRTSTATSRPAKSGDKSPHSKAGSCQHGQPVPVRSVYVSRNRLRHLVPCPARADHARRGSALREMRLLGADRAGDVPRLLTLEPRNTLNTRKNGIVAPHNSFAPFRLPSLVQFRVFSVFRGSPIRSSG